MRAETGQALLAITAHLAGPGQGPGLSALAGRIAASRGLPAASLLDLVPAQPAAVPADAESGRPSRAQPGPPLSEPADGERGCAAEGRAVPAGQLALVGAHGGAGVSSLLRCGLQQAGAVDGQRRWPAAGLVLLVARTSTVGVQRVRDLAREHAGDPASPGARVCGLVLVADAPGRLPPRVRELADLVSGAVPRLWQVPWLEEWRLAALDQPLPAHPEVSRLLADVRRLTTAPTRPELTCPVRPSVRPSIQGALL